MQNDHSDLPEILMDYVPCSACSYTEWLQVGMALKESGHKLETWDEWSRTDPSRYKKGECLKKWWGFNRHDVKSGTIIDIAKRFGYRPGEDGNELLDWDSTFDYVPDPTENNLKIIDKNWVQGEDVPLPGQIFGGAFDPTKEIKTYLETLFRSDEYVAYSVDCYESKSDDGKPSKWLPKASASSRTAGELIQSLVTSDISCTFGTIHEEAGAWIRFNPMDGKGYRDENVSDYRYALVECDDMPIDKQYAMIRQMELPVAIMIHSGGKSLHAIVKVDASSMSQYRERVDYLYKVCETNGLKLDKQNRNPSRLSRMPGVMRQGRPQYIISLACGKDSWNEWVEYVEAINDELPDIEEMYDLTEQMPPLAPELIEGVLRQGHKMMLSGPSKAGKSFALMELSIAIATGGYWLGFKCAQGRVLYINLEVDPISCIHRFDDIRRAYDLPRDIFRNISVWNLRGSGEPMNTLTPKLIRRAKTENYIAVILDPIYKVGMGDENAADQVAKFCNEFDKVAKSLGCSFIFCHHHSKSDMHSRDAINRASGSGVFARDPDAIVDMIQVKVKEEGYDEMALAHRTKRFAEHILCQNPSALNGTDLTEREKVMNVAKSILPNFKEIFDKIRKEEEAIYDMTAWKIEGTLREFRSFKPIVCWFQHPLHVPDTHDIINRYKGATGPEKAKNTQQAKQNGNIIEVMNAIIDCNGIVSEVYEKLNATDESTKRKVRRWAKSAGFASANGRFMRITEEDPPFNEEE